MKIILNNFKCYRGTRTFDISNEGITLLQGESGKGKSTLMYSIVFCLYGGGKGLVSDGEASAFVELELDWGCVKRTIHPNTLVVWKGGKEMRDEVAQHFLYTLYGKCFEYTSYIAQLTCLNFLCQTPMEKLSILETLLFDDCDPEAYRKRCSEEIRQLTKDLSRVEGELSILEPITQQEPPTPPTSQGENRADVERRLLNLKSKQYIFDTFTLKHRNLKSEVGDLEHQLAQTPRVEGNVELVEKALMLKRQLPKNFSADKVWEPMSREECVANIKDIEKDLDVVRRFTRIRGSADKLASTEERIQQLEKEIHQIRHAPTAVFVCPNTQCGSKLKLVNGNLELGKENDLVLSSSSLSLLEGELRSLYKNVNMLKEWAGEEEELKELIPSETEEELINELKSTRGYLIEQDALGRYLRIYQDIPDIYRETSIADLEGWIKARRTLESVERELKSKTFQLERLEEAPQKPTDHSEAIQSLEKQLYEFESEDLRAQVYQRYLEQMEKYRDTRTRESRLQKQLEAVVQLKDLLLATEMEYIQISLNTINKFANEIAEELFPEGISCFLSLYSSTGKPQINIDIVHNNIKCSYSMLSGGEQTRLNIAFTLAFGKFFESRWLLLDESTSQLNQEATELVFKVVKRHVSDCKVIFIAHQVVQGVFDQVIHI